MSVSSMVKGITPAQGLRVSHLVLNSFFILPSDPRVSNARSNAGSAELSNSLLVQYFQLSFCTKIWERNLNL
eukprot:152962-Pelagomonas_calceolata.AAC.1